MHPCNDLSSQSRAHIPVCESKITQKYHKTIWLKSTAHSVLWAVSYLYLLFSTLWIFFPFLRSMEKGRTCRLPQHFELSVHGTDGQVEATDLVCCQRHFYQPPSAILPLGPGVHFLHFECYVTQLAGISCTDNCTETLISPGVHQRMPRVVEFSLLHHFSLDYTLNNKEETL